jgi:HEAT repeat protein
MAKIDAQLARLNAITGDPSTLQAVAEIEGALLRGKSTVVAARAAEIAARAGLERLEPALLEAFDRFMHETDKGCIAKTAIARALLELESRAELTLLRGARHVQMEPAFPRAADVAAELRAACAVALVNMRSRQAINVLVHHLADKEPFVRSAAVRTLAAHGGDAAEALVRYKLLVGDDDFAVVADCFPAAVALARSTEPVEAFLDSPDDALREAAILAVGESRLPRAFDSLRDRWDVEVDSGMRKLLATSIALTRQPAAVAFLVQQAEQGDSAAASAAIEALAMYRSDESVRAKLAEIAEKRGGTVGAAFARAFATR